MNVIKVVDDEGVVGYFDGLGLTAKMCDAKHYSKLGGKIMKRHVATLESYRPNSKVTMEELKIESPPIEAEEPEAEEGEKEKPTMSGQLNRYREKYSDAVSYAGKKSKVNGDEISLALLSLTPKQVMNAAEKVLGLPENELVSRYASLNPGQQRMNAGNRIRAAVKRGDVTIESVRKVVH